jgi:hypothetical protein
VKILEESFKLKGNLDTGNDLHAQAIPSIGNTPACLIQQFNSFTDIITKIFMGSPTNT